MPAVTAWKIPIDTWPWVEPEVNPYDDVYPDNTSFPSVGGSGWGPTCASRGLQCPQLYSPAQIANYTVIVLRSVLTVVVLYLSIKLRGDVIAVMTLNLFIPSVICDLASTLAQIIDVFSLYYSGIYITDGAYAVLMIAQGVTGMVCRLFTLFFVTTFLVAFSSPIFYHRRFASRSNAPYYWAMHMFAIVCTACARIPDFTSTLWMLEDATNLGYHIILIILTFGTLIVTIKAITAVSKYKPHSSTSEDHMKNRKRLISFLAYCIPMNILNIPLAVFVITQLHGLHVGNAQMFAYVNNFFVATEYQLRTIIISLCTLSALTPYRKAFCSLFTKNRRRRESPN